MQKTGWRYGSVFNHHIQQKREAVSTRPVFRIIEVAEKAALRKSDN